jgi:acetyl esterase/lipase
MRALSGKLLRVAASLALIVPTLGCAPARVLNALVSKQGYHIEQNVAYGNEARQQLDIYVPDSIPSERNVAIFFYGGRWEYGSKADYRFVGQALASRGIVTVIADYRLFPDVQFPAFIEDGAKAVGWVRRHIAEYDGDPDRIHLIGHSAGAYIAAMLALDPGFLAAEGIDVLDVEGMIGLAGPYDFLPIKDPVVRQVFAVDDLDATQPVNHADRERPRLLLLTGDDDETVLPRNSVRLGARIQDLEGKAAVKVYPDIGHVGVVLALASPFRWLAPVLQDVTSFIGSAD